MEVGNDSLELAGAPCSSLTTFNASMTHTDKMNKENKSANEENRSSQAHIEAEERASEGEGECAFMRVES